MYVLSTMCCAYKIRLFGVCSGSVVGCAAAPRCPFRSRGVGVLLGSAVRCCDAEHDSASGPVGGQLLAVRFLQVHKACLSLEYFLVWLLM